MSEKYREKFGWKIGETTRVFESPFFRIATAKVICPRTGITQSYYRSELSPWVNILAFTPRQEIVLVRQFRFGTEAMEWELPGGIVEDGEDPLPAALRELQEETGFVGKNAEVIGRTSPNSAIQDNDLFTILVKDAEKLAETKMDPMEDIETRLAGLDEVFAMIKDGTLRHAFTQVALMRWFLHTGRLG
ncbi:MAG: NUDIX hydrolase [Desulforhopalus sp.]|nr:NUDIX hydrolase [Desulforhopalus sp.]